MIKAMIQNSSVAFSAERIMRAQEITFPCSETELSKRLGEIGMNPEHLAPMATVIEIEPTELLVLEDCEVSLDVLNYLGKRLDGMDESEYKQFLAVLSCHEISEGWGLKNIINLTDNLTLSKIRAGFLQRSIFLIRSGAVTAFRNSRLSQCI